ncbi:MULTISPECIES: hypothetical protein [unclassified Bradyrhizobium]|nr:hypothetical protein [Bradyrhizobium sp. CB2312]WFU76385.1 hypothetical protein QA642_21455 [Bradyrhizobium sp. CB2312]
MKVIVDETGEVIAIATDDHILLGGPPSPGGGGEHGQKVVLARYRRTCEA